MNVRIDKSQIHQFGVFANETIPLGEYDTVHGRYTDFETRYIIDRIQGPFEPYPPYKYLNHSDNPNCILEVDEFQEMFVTAVRDIAPDEELTIDYGEDYEF